MNNSTEVMEELKSFLFENGVKFNVCNIDELKADGNFVFVTGGDGTILKAARFYSQYDIPIFGINLGRVGFLSQASRNDLKTSIKEVLNGNYKIENRMMLNAGNYNALNDFVIKGDESSRTSRFALEINGKFVCEYLADGIIVSTPTGSTAYAMAAGGPVLEPELDAITIVPICPHSFSARPIVVSGNDLIKILPCENSEYRVSADGQVAFSLTAELLIKKSAQQAKLALLTDNDFYKILRNKLNWSYAPAKCSS